MLTVLERLDDWTRDIPVRRKLLFTFYIVSLVPLLIAAAIFYYSSSNVLKDELGASALEMTKQSSQQLDAFLLEIERLSQIISNHPDAQSFMNITSYSEDISEIQAINGLRRLFLSMISLRSGMSELFLVNDYGMTVYDSSSGYLRPDYQFLQQDWFQRATQSRAPQMISREQDYMQNEPVVTIAIRLVNYSTMREGGTLLFDFQPRYITGLSSDVKLGRTGHLFFLNIDGVPIEASSKYSEVLQGEPSFLQALTGNQGYYTVNHDGQKLLISYSTSRYSSWKAVGVVPLEELTSGIKKTQVIMAMVALIVVALVFILSMAISKAIIKPLVHLENYMAIAEKGDLTIRLPIERADEFGRLGRKFNRMVEQLGLLNSKVESAQLKEYHAILLHRESELKALQAQINPHFLYNTLNTISCYGELHDIHEISHMSRSLASMFQYSIKDSKYTVLHHEMEHVKAFLDIIGYRYPDLIQCHWDIPDKLMEQAVVLKLIIQPIVENAVIHGLLPKATAGGNIWINAHVKNEDTMLIRVVDDGVGIPEVKAAQLQADLNSEAKVNMRDSGHMGLRNVHQRLQLFYSGAGSLRFASSSEQGTVVELRLPLELSEEGGDYE